MPIGRALASVLTITRNEKSEHSLDNDERDSGNHQHYEEKTVNAFAVHGGQGRKPIWLCNKEIQGSKNKNQNQGRQDHSAESNSTRPAAVGHHSLLKYEKPQNIEI